MTITLNSLGSLFICTIRDKNLDLELRYSALDTAGTLLLAKTLRSTGPGLGRAYELGSPHVEGERIFCVKGAWEEF